MVLVALNLPGLSMVPTLVTATAAVSVNIVFVVEIANSAGLSGGSVAKVIDRNNSGTGCWPSPPLQIWMRLSGAVVGLPVTMMAKLLSMLAVQPRTPDAAAVPQESRTATAPLLCQPAVLSPLSFPQTLPW